MKRFNAMFMVVSVLFMYEVCYAKISIEKLMQPYEKALDFISHVDPVCQVNDHDIFIFFNQSGLYKKRDVIKFNSVVRQVKRLTYAKKNLRMYREKLELLIDQLVKIQQFVATYSSTYYALVTYYEIAAHYYYIDEQHSLIIPCMMQQSEKLGLPHLQGRGLYKFVQKIDLDLRRLTALFVQNVVSDDLVVKMNQIKSKLITLKNKIIVSDEYRSQRRKTRCLKALGLFLLCSLAVPVGLVLAGTFSTEQTVYVFTALCGLPVLLLPEVIITTKELKESSQYNIPVHSTSLFSWFRPIFWPLTWISRG